MLQAVHNPNRKKTNELFIRDFSAGSISRWQLSPFAEYLINVFQTISGKLRDHSD